MFRKTTLALAAIAALGVAALAPTSASAGWKGKHWHGHHSWHGKHWGHGGYGFGINYYAPSYVYGGCYSVKRIVATPFGPKLRYVTVCN
jgi:hypothetical protein